MKVKTSAGSVPPGLTLYELEYPVGHWSEECWAGQHNPPTCFIESDKEALAFAQRMGASRITNAITGQSFTL